MGRFEECGRTCPGAPETPVRNEDKINVPFPFPKAFIILAEFQLLIFFDKAQAGPAPEIADSDL